jgi:uncharacterized protein (TIGR02266 family)
MPTLQPGTWSYSRRLTHAFIHSILGNVPTQDIPLVRIQLRYPDEATFIQRFAPNVTRGGIFLASRSPLPVNTVLAFEVMLTQGPPLLRGTGKVTWIREFNPNEPQRAHGMGVQFIQVAQSCRPILDKLLEQKAHPARLTPVNGPGSAAHPTQAGSLSSHPSITLEGDPNTWIDDQGMRKAIDRARFLASRIDDVESLRIREDEEPPNREEALAQLPRTLGFKR